MISCRFPGSTWRQTSASVGPHVAATRLRDILCPATFWPVSLRNWVDSLYPDPKVHIYWFNINETRQKVQADSLLFLHFFIISLFFRSGDKPRQLNVFDIHMDWYLARSWDLTLLVDAAKSDRPSLWPDRDTRQLDCYVHPMMRRPRYIDNIEIKCCE